MIPNHTHDGVLPPFIPGATPSDTGAVAPYRTDLADFAERFAGTVERRAILSGLVAYRTALRAIGITSGFQWLDGSFVEDCEAVRGRVPKDIDLVTFSFRPKAYADTTAWRTLVHSRPDLFDPETTKAILEKVASSNEIDFEEVAEQLDPRMLISLKDFFVTLDAAEATVRLVDDVADISLDQPAVHRARMRTEATSIDETDLLVEGVLVGFLPEHRKFEIQVGQSQTLYGSVSKEAAEQYAQLLARGENPERQTWKVRIRQRTVTPLNRPPRDVNRLLEFVGRANA